MKIFGTYPKFTNVLVRSVSWKLSVCKELQLPSSEYSYTADLMDVTSKAPLETAAVQSISVLAVAAEGTARFWPSLAQEGNYTEIDVDMAELCNYVVAVEVSRGGVFSISTECGRRSRLVVGCILLCVMCDCMSSNTIQYKIGPDGQFNANRNRNLVTFDYQSVRGCDLFTYITG